MKTSLVVPCVLVSVVLLAGVRASKTAGRDAQTAGASGEPQTYAGLEISVASVERAASAPLKDCPPGSNTVKAMTRPGEEFAVVLVNFKVLPAFEPTMIGRPVLEGADGETYKTAISFVDVGSVPEFSCAFPFRVKEGTKLKSLKIDDATFDLEALDAGTE